jgi:hypothetical protein
MAFLNICKRRGGIVVTLIGDIRDFLLPVSCFLFLISSFRFPWLFNVSFLAYTVPFRYRSAFTWADSF